MTYRLLALVSALGIAACASSPPAAPGAPAPAATAPPGTPPAAAAPPGSAAVESTPDWNAPPTNGSPGVDVPKVSGNELLNNTDFDTGKYIPWTTSFTAPGAGNGYVSKGQFCVDVTNKGNDPWDAQMRHREMIIQKGHVYSIKYMAHSTKPIQMKAKVGMSGPPYKEYWADTVDLNTRPQTFVGVFTMEEDDDPTAELAFHFGGPNAGDTQAPYTVCFDDMHLDDPKFVKQKKAEETPILSVTVNQTGYLPALPKLATVKSASKTPLKWELQKQGGGVAASGDTKPLGKDAASGEEVHLVDFSSVTVPGKGYTLKVGADVSHPFDIARRPLPQAQVRRARDLLSPAKRHRDRDAVRGRQAVDAARRPREQEGARPGQDLTQHRRQGGPLSEGFGLRLHAGCHGRLVRRRRPRQVRRQRRHCGLDDAEPVRARRRERGTAGDFGDGKMNIPEKKNKVPDLLDEARLELEFMLKMQVPDGKPKAGMVHHKIHDKEWTALGMFPDEDAQARFLWPPSTAATLNLAATAAQGARIFAKLDKKFSDRCLKAAEKAWAAAAGEPGGLRAATAAIGGGPYDDKDVSDEFYWAAAELYVTTKKDVVQGVPREVAALQEGPERARRRSGCRRR